MLNKYTTHMCMCRKAVGRVELATQQLLSSLPLLHCSSSSLHAIPLASSSASSSAHALTRTGVRASPPSSPSSNGRSRDIIKAPMQLARAEETRTTSLGSGCRAAGIETSVRSRHIVKPIAPSTLTWLGLGLGLGLGSRLALGLGGWVRARVRVGLRVRVRAQHAYHAQG